MKLLKLFIASTLMLMIYISPASAEYSYQLVIPPGAENANLFGINNAGKVVGGVYDDFEFLYSFEYDMKKGVYTTISEEFDAIEISNPGVMVGSDLTNDLCTIREKDGTLTYFYPPSWTVNSFCTGRGVNPDGKVSGFVVDEFGDWFVGFIYDSEYGTFEEFLPSWQTIAHGINAQGQNAGSVDLDTDEAYLGSPWGFYGYLRQTDGSVKYFAISESQSYPGETQARGISENGLISGYYLSSDTWEYTGFVTTLSKGEGFESIVLTDDQVIHLSPCDPDLQAPPTGYELLTDVFLSQVRNDGVVVGQCADYHYNFTTDHWIVYTNYGLIATPIK
jgi:hypothetical protein